MQVISNTTELLYRYMKHLRQTQNEISNKIGVTQSTISNIFSGKKQISRDIAERFQSAYGISAEWILYGNGEMLINGETPEIPLEVRKMKLDEAEEKDRLINIIAEQQRTIERLTKLLQKSYECSTK